MKRRNILFTVTLLTGGLALWYWHGYSDPGKPAAPVAAERLKTGSSRDQLAIAGRFLEPMSQYGSAAGAGSSDIQLLHGTIRQWRSANGELPSGVNVLLTEALCSGGKGHPLLARDHPCIGKDGCLNDRWGNPVWFHEESRNNIEIGFAGPDKQLGTDDDIILAKGRVLTGEELRSRRATSSAIAGH